MGDNHTVYTAPEGQTTQWDDIQRKLGNLPPKAPPPKAAPWTPAEAEAPPRRDAAWLQAADADALAAAADEPTLADDRSLEALRAARLAALRAGAARPRFGALADVGGGADFVAQVTHAPRGAWVVCHLHRPGHRNCGVLDQCLAALAAEHPHTKFVRCVATDAIPGYPDAALPTVLLYRDGVCRRTLAGMGPYGGRDVSVARVAATLNAFGGGDAKVCGGGGGGDGDGDGGGARRAAASEDEDEGLEERVAARRGGGGDDDSE